MTVSPASRPILPVLRRMAFGLLLAGAGGLLAWKSVTITPTPGMSTTLTPIELPLDGPEVFDLAQLANLRLEGDRLNVTAAALPSGNPMILQGEVKHRVRNPVALASQRTGRTVDATLGINVKSLGGGVRVSEPEPVQHTAALNLTRMIPLTLSSRTTTGDQTLDLTGLRLRALTVRTLSGNQQVTLPGRPGGPFSLVSSSGNLAVNAPPGTNLEALRVNAVDGGLKLDLTAVKTQALGVGTSSGYVRIILPIWTARGTVTTSSGDVNITAPEGTKGNLDIRTQSGDVTLRVPTTLKLRVRFTDRDTITLPTDLPLATAPDLDVFVDAPGDQFRLRDLNGNAIPGISNAVSGGASAYERSTPAPAAPPTPPNLPSVTSPAAPTDPARSARPSGP